MTALKPIENRKVRGVPSETYPLGHVCAHPECTNTDVTAHHIFPRSSIKSKSWFVQIEGHPVTRESSKGKDQYEIETTFEDIVIPHVVPLCGSGTTGHHGDIEEHRAWIKLENEEYVWYDRNKSFDGTAGGGSIEWDEIGALNPQPAYGEGKPKRKKKAVTPEERAARVNWTVRSPAGEPNMIPEVIEYCKEALAEEYGRKVYDYETNLLALLEFQQNHKLKKKKR